jgi:WD40 repeat protein
MERRALIVALTLCTAAVSAPADETTRTPLRLVQTITLPHVVAGRIDHVAVDVQGQRLFVAALGNNSVEVVDLRAGQWTRSVAALRKPQGVVFVPELNRLFVANGGDGTLNIFDGSSLAVIRQVKFSGEADNLRYDSTQKRLYVGYGDGALGTVDPASGERMGDMKLRGHPESFQLEASGPRVFANVPTTNEVAVTNRETGVTTATWPVGPRANFPMALDTSHHRLFIACRTPPTLVIFDTESGTPVASLDSVGDADDLFYDSLNKRVYVSGGEGVIQVLRQRDPDHYEPQARIATRAGARTSLLVPELGRLYLAVPSGGDEPAEIRGYAVDP